MIVAEKEFSFHNDVVVPVAETDDSLTHVFVLGILFIILITCIVGLAVRKIYVAVRLRRKPKKQRELEDEEGSESKIPLRTIELA